MSEIKVTFLVSIFWLLFSQNSNSQNLSFPHDGSRDVISIDSNAWLSFPDSVLLQIDFRQFSGVNMYIDSVYYEFRILSLNMFRKNKIKIRVLHLPLNNQEYPFEKFIAYYQIYLNRIDKKYKIIRVKRLLTEL
jgi:hypothetical protein